MRRGPRKCQWLPVASLTTSKQTDSGPGRAGSPGPGGTPGIGQGHLMAANDREKALETALAQIERQFGKGSVMRLGEEGRAPIEVIPTGAISLDVALGIG